MVAFDVSQAMTPSLLQAVCFSYAPLPKKKKKKKKMQWNLVSKIAQKKKKKKKKKKKTIWAVVLKPNVLIGDDK